MSFLKDAGTAAVYGTRAGNGVVLVTTKKGLPRLRYSMCRVIIPSVHLHRLYWPI
ncbi:hypothetical protein KUH03_16850 [Sphingobacterium sp. E70]|uniref:hypothetical protein n=1 Tax=Sphingobacterium sp. E70 TaxID=2853439 RepID=UPI00211C552A|nr:hypothetical protein [Sphingobacterium sp. E70]ULT28118.1 hypothetical protein KUH03_16850 [Sphingobacterium sp. E70]